MNSKLSDDVSLQSKAKRLEKSNLLYRKKIKYSSNKTEDKKLRLSILQRELKILQNIESSSEDMSEDCISENEIYKELLNHQIENDNAD
ncbi:hypothetical protein CEXT_471071 [Caerostris extrusa]|uniref:Uncharacterized protein n=1 Tax=Caerostris extrusa TaxID=172846 RepID=A0AAV4PUR9_CAEEX|nr:hypothetical protein CEXT_471071 [Caerostris extrusa]